MASLHQQHGRPFWFVSYFDHEGKRRHKSTKTKDLAEAQIVAQAFESMVRERKYGPFTGTRAGRLIEEFMADLSLNAEIDPKEPLRDAASILPSPAGKAQCAGEPAVAKIGGLDWELVDVPRVRCGIYALLGPDGRVLYIGQSLNIHGRLMQHRQDKLFHSAAFIDVPRDRLDQVESSLIERLKPPMNRKGNPGWNWNEQGMPEYLSKHPQLALLQNVKT